MGGGEGSWFGRFGAAAESLTAGAKTVGAEGWRVGWGVCFCGCVFVCSALVADDG